MRHRIAGYKLGRDSEHRKAMWRNMTISLLTYGQITTTVPKAKSVRPFVEKLITTARQGDLASRRRVIKALGNPVLIKGGDDDDVRRNKYGEVVGGPRVVKHLFDEVAPRYTDRQGGYTRIVRLSKHRIGDGADLCVLQLVGNEEGPQVSGQYSRRREQADRRMEFAAQLRKSSKADAPVVEAEAKSQAEASSSEQPSEPESDQQQAQDA